MSYYNSSFDLDFKKSFSSSYVNFSNDEIYNMAQNILSELTKVSDHGDQKFLSLLRNKKIHRHLKRWQLCLLTDLLRGDLIDSGAQVVVGAFGPFCLGGA